MSTLIAYQRATSDWRGFTLRQYDFENLIWEDYTGAWSYQITAYGTQPDPDEWLPAVPMGAMKGVAITGLTAGYYWIWFRIDDADPYVPVNDPIELAIL